jgi:hypothetical protein
VDYFTVYSNVKSKCVKINVKIILVKQKNVKKIFNVHFYTVTKNILPCVCRSYILNLFVKNGARTYKYILLSCLKRANLVTESDNRQDSFHHQHHGRETADVGGRSREGDGGGTKNRPKAVGGLQKGEGGQGGRNSTVLDTNTGESPSSDRRKLVEAQKRSQTKRAGPS